MKLYRGDSYISGFAQEIDTKDYENGFRLEKIREGCYEIFFYRNMEQHSIGKYFEDKTAAEKNLISETKYVIYYLQGNLAKLKQKFE